MKPFLRLLLLGLAFCSAAGLFGSLHWAFDLFNHWRVQALVASLALGIIALWVDRKLACLAGCILLLNSVLIAVRLYATSPVTLPVTSSAQPLSIVASNVYTMNRNDPAVLAMIVREKPDIVVFTETDARWIGQLAPLEKDYPYRLTHPRPDNFGIAVYAKLPFNARMQEVGDYRLPLGVLEFVHFTLLVAHPIPPLSETSMKENRLYLDTLAELSRTNHRPTLVAGDLNTTLWSQTLTPLIAAELKRIHPWGIAFTWPVHYLPLALQIDHFFTKGMNARNFEVLEDIGSDHYPIRAEFLIPLP